MSSIAIVGLACTYPDAETPQQLWDNVLGGRRSFRPIPPERLRLEDYGTADHSAIDLTYARYAAVIEGYHFDRARFRVVGSTYRSTDLSHWLALDVASRALADAGFPDAKDLPRETTGVIVGNTLTGEFSRAAVMRLRWPYVKRVVEARLRVEDWPANRRAQFLAELEQLYKNPFEPTGEETLAGGLSNTIAGRICNQFDLGGGGFTIDGACSSSLLAIANGCSSLAAGDNDVALVGGVDLSLDPFELVGFSRVGALARGEMRVFDAHPTGFLPGEGCGFAVLMRYEDALKRDLRIYAVVKGWGISSDGSGGLTRPEVEGQQRALSRAYRRAGYGISTVGYFEGHGTGTEIGDSVELETLVAALQQDNTTANAYPAVIGSVKANIGHTKAAAGMAGFIKAAMATHNRIVPPNTGLRTPHPTMIDNRQSLKFADQADSFPRSCVRASVSSMGFGGINAHVTMEGIGSGKSRPKGTVKQYATEQDGELFLLAAGDASELKIRVAGLTESVSCISFSEMTDLAALMADELKPGKVRAAVVASSPDELKERLDLLGKWLEEGITRKIDTTAGLFVGDNDKEPMVAFLFSGQASPANLDGGLWARRFGVVRELYDRAELPTGSDGVETSIAQPAIVTASMAGLRMLEAVNIIAEVAVGHSLGEFSALHWAGVMDEAALLRMTRARGKAMSEHASAEGAMAAIAAGHSRVLDLIGSDEISIAGINSPKQTIVSGKVAPIDAIIRKAKAAGLSAVRLAVSHAFHSPLMKSVIEPLSKQIGGERLLPCAGKVISTVSGGLISDGEDIRQLLYDQLIKPVRFAEAVERAASEADLLIEVGPGRVLSGIAKELTDLPILSLDCGSRSVKGLLGAVGAAFALGVDIRPAPLFARRYVKPFDINKKTTFFVNPCELAPLPDDEVSSILKEIESRKVSESEAAVSPETISRDPMELVRQLVSEKTELPLEAVTPTSGLLEDLHLNSLAVSQIVAEAARLLGLPPLASPNEYATATVGQVAQSLAEMIASGGQTAQAAPERYPAGLDSWVRMFKVELVERKRNHAQQFPEAGEWKLISHDEDSYALTVAKALNKFGGGGVLLSLPVDPGSDEIGLLIETSRAVLNESEPTRLVVIQNGGSASAFAKTLHLEANNLTTCIINAPQTDDAVGWIVDEACSAAGYTEVNFDEAGTRRVPIVSNLDIKENGSGDLPLDSNDVLLVTGGGKGIAAESAISLAKETGAGLILLGRSHPDSDEELSSNLARMKALELRFVYEAADVRDAEAVQAAVSRAEKEIGRVSGIIHGAGINVPALLRSLDEAAFRKTMEPKIQGARNVLAAVDQDRLKLFVSFGSIIARTGLPGEADYGLANQCLRTLTEKLQLKRPHIRCLCIEWSIWSGVGMGERLGRVEALIREGVSPISPDQGIDILHRLLKSKTTVTSVIVSGRFGQPETMPMEMPELPLRRFLEQPKLYYPGIELIAEAELSAEADPYLHDHTFRGERLLPGVLGMEAMMQAASVLHGAEGQPTFSELRFDRPIVVPTDGKRRIRLLALRRENGQIEVSLRSEETDFQVDHFSATCVFENENEGSWTTAASGIDASQGSLSIDPARDMYGSLLFHKGRFCRLSSYRRLSATECLAEIVGNGNSAWFGRYLPGALLLGDPGVRDAMIHAIQACVPNATLLPVSAERVRIGSSHAALPLFVRAVERSRVDDLFTYDVTLFCAGGIVCEEWLGLQLRVIGGTERHNDWSPVLLGPYIERQLGRLVENGRVSVAIEQNGTEDRRVRSQGVIRRAAGEDVIVTHRTDGKPEVSGNGNVSASHTDDISMAVAGEGALGCDIEMVRPQSRSAWQDLLGVEGTALADLVAADRGEEFDVAATRVWTSTESLKKAGAAADAPLALGSLEENGWVLFKSGCHRIASYVAELKKENGRLALAVLRRDDNASL